MHFEISINFVGVRVMHHLIVMVLLTASTSHRKGSEERVHDQKQAQSQGDPLSAFNS